MTKAETILAAVNSGATDEELTILDGTPEDQFGKENKSEEGKTNGSTTSVADVEPKSKATDGDYAYETGSLESQGYNFNPEILQEEERDPINIENKKEEKSVADILKGVNLYKGFTIGDFFSGDDEGDDEGDEDVIEGGELDEVTITPTVDSKTDDFLLDIPTTEPDATRVAPVIAPEIIQEDIEEDWYWDDSTNEIKVDSPETIADLLREEEEVVNVTTIDGEVVDIGPPETTVEVEPHYDPADDLWLNKGIDILENLAKVTWDLTTPGEVAQLWDQSKKIFSNIDNSLYNAGLSTQIDMAKILEKSLGDEKEVSLVVMDQVSGFNGGEAVWITPEGKIVSSTNTSVAAEDKVLNGWKMIYKDSGVEVGSPYKEWTLKKYEKLILVESMRAKTDVGFVEGYKEGDASTFFGGGVLAISSLAETMVPALLTYGASLIPQITAPMYIAYNRERAKMLYPSLSEADGIAKMIENNEEDVLAPNILGLLAAGLERVGLKGISKAMLANKKGFSKVVTSMILAGNKEGLTEWAQLGTDTLNKELGKGTDYDVALAIAWDTMVSEEGLEMYLMGLVGGFSVTSGGALINRALRSDQSSVRYVNSKIYEIGQLNSKQVKTPKAKEAIQKQIDVIIADLKKFVESSKKIKKYLTKEEQSKLVERLSAYDLKRREYVTTKLEYHGGVTQYALENGIDIEQALRDGFPELATEWEIVKDGLNKEADKIQADIEAIKNAANERLIDAGIKKAKNKGNSITVFKDAAELETWLTVNEKTLKYPKEKYRNGSGWEIGGNVFINKLKAIEVGAISVAEHEVAHVLFGRMLRKDGDLTIEGIKFIDDFKATLPNKVIVAITKRLKDAGYNMSDPNVQEEYLTHYIDGVIAGEWGTNRKTLKLLGDEVTSLMKDNGYSNVEFTTIQDVLDWLTSYVRDKDSNKSPVERKKPTEGGANVTNLSTTDLKPPVDKLGEVDQATWDKSGATKAFEYIYGKLDGFIWKYVSSETKMVDDFDKENHMQDTYFELLPHIRNFVPAQYNEDGSRKIDAEGNPIGNDSLWGWIIPYIKFKGMNAIKKLDFEFTVSIEDEGSYVTDIEADDFVDIDVVIEEDITFTILRRLLNVERDGELHKKIKNGIAKIIPFELDKLDTKEFKIAIQKYFKANLFDDLKKIIGTAGSDKYKMWITNNGKALYNLLPQLVMNNQYSEFTIKGKRLNVTETRKAIADGLLPKGTNVNDKAGNYLYTKMPYAEIEQLWIDSFTKKDRTGLKGRPGSKQNSLLDLMAWFLGFDATMEVINTKTFKEKNGIPQAIIATIGLKIDRGANVRFNTGTETYVINENNFNVQAAMQIARWVEDNVGFDEIDPKGLAYILENEFPGDFKLERALVVKMSDTGTIINTDSQRFKKAIANDPDISPEVKAQIKKDGAIRDNEKALEKILEAAELIAPKLGPRIMKILGFDIFGFTNRVLNSAERQQDPDWDGVDKNKKWLTDDDGNYISAPYYDGLEALKLKVKKGEVELPDGLILSDLRLMNKKFIIFKKVEKILFDGDSKIDGSNIKWKKAQIAKLNGEIKAAGKANLILAKYIAKVMIESGVDQATVVHMLQIQTSIVSGFRALTSLDIITILEGSQEPGTGHPYFQAELAIAKKARDKKGKLKYPTEELAVKAAIDATGTKGEHAAANSNTMAKIANLHARYLADSDIDLDAELDAIFAGHGQIHGTKGTFNIVDEIGGTTNAADWLRVMIDPRRKDMFSPDGLTAEEVVVKKTAPTTMFSKSDMVENIKLKNLNKAPIIGASVFDFDGTLEEGGKNMIVATHPETGEVVSVSSHDFHGQVGDLIKRGFEFNFDDFVNVKESKKGPMFQKLLNQIKKYGVENIYILTARQPGAALAIRMWLEQNGVNLLPENITGLGVLGPDGKPIVVTGKHKADWIEDNLILKGFNDIYFVDDGKKIVDEVDKMFNTYPEGLLVDGGKSVLVDTNFSISDQFNQMLEENEGVGKHKVYSEAKGKIEGGSKKNFWNLILPPSAYDFELFLYRIIGRGKKGKEDLAWFKNHLLDPYDAAYKNMQDDAQRTTDEFKALVKRLPGVKKNLKKLIPGTKFTYEQALRVSIWTDMGLEVPGLSKTDLKKLLIAINNDPSLIEYKEGLKDVLADGYPPPTDYWTIEGVAYDLDRSINAISRAKHLAAWKEKKDEIFSKENRSKLEAIYGERYVESLDNMLYRMEFGGNKKKVSRIESNWNTWVNNSVGAIMFFNFRSATLQTISAINFVDWENNTPYKAAKAFANVNQYRKDFVKILFSNYLKQRRGGGKRTLNEAELTEYLKGKKNPLKGAIAWMLEKGFTPTSAADSLAIAVGGATFYRNQVKYHLEQGRSLEEAETQAWIDFSAKSEKGQQSSRPDLLSEQQAGGLGRLILAFKNTQQQYFRIMTKATLDIKNKRGSLKANLSKIAYYGVLQNALFASLQTAIFAAFDDDEEWDSKTDRMAQTMIDSVLAGLGLTGAVIITVKNGILMYVEQKEKGFNADHTRTILQFANLSPTIGSKLRKLYSAIRTEQLNQDAIDKMGLDINSPAVNSIASLISAATNVPVDRAVTITQNLILASTDEANFNQSLALILGWSAWDIGMEPVSRKVQQEAKEERKKLMEKLKLMEKEKENLAKQKALKDKGFCAGAKKDGKDCSLPVVEGTSFCTVHAKVEERKDGKKLRCKKIKAGGKQCGTMTSAKSGLCYYHD